MRPAADSNILQRLRKMSQAGLTRPRTLERRSPPCQIHMHRAAGPVADLKLPERVLGRCPVTGFEREDVPPHRDDIAPRKVVPHAETGFGMGAAFIPSG